MAAENIDIKYVFNSPNNIAKYYGHYILKWSSNMLAIMIVLHVYMESYCKSIWLCALLSDVIIFRFLQLLFYTTM